MCEHAELFEWYENSYQCMECYKIIEGEKNRMKKIYYFQAMENLNVGEYVVVIDVNYIRKPKFNVFPQGVVLSDGSHGVYYNNGEIVPIEPLFDNFGRLVKTLDLDGRLYQIGMRYEDI